MTILNVSIPDELERFLNSEATAHGYRSTADYVRSILEAMQNVKTKTQLEETLVRRIDGPASIDLTPEVWSALQTRVNKRLSITH
jgi:antitoxin ParD1/3/4